MRNWPNWIPSVNAWLNAIALVLLLGGLSLGNRYLSILLQFLIKISPKLGILVWFSVYLLPIPIIAVAHHFLHRFLDLYFPDTRSPELSEIRGWIPTLMSWWEGLYGWIAILLSTFISNTILFLIFAPSTATFNSLDLHNYASNPFALPLLVAFIWLVSSAYLYQLEYLVRQHLMAVGGRN
ncbi:MAG: hypothetical protein SVX43_00245 [Cyanobacteriota bacterium]|nr:hypothetical protein [Cyanobacteriota bacterium]